MLIDSHCHLDGKTFADDRDAVLATARDAGVEGFLTIGTGDGPPDLEPAIRVAEQYHDVWATVGVHPHDAAKSTPEALTRLQELCSHPKVLAVGEIGLDYHYDHSPRSEQKRVFIEQMGVAALEQKPILIHTREAWDDTLALLAEHWAPTGLGGIMHCFSGNLEQAQASIEMGFHISFAGMLTFGRSDELRHTAAALPLNRLLVETDSPYLTPAPFRKVRRNEPRYVVETARKLAEVQGLQFERVCEATTVNFYNLFKLQRPE